MIKRFLLLSCLSSAVVMQAQQHNHIPCMTDEVYKEQVKQNPAIKQAEAEFNAYAAGYKPNTKRAGKIIIPVVFHVFHNNGPENISKAQILDQIRILNLDYQRLNSDTNKTRPIFKGVAADCGIEFRLATLDPDGNCTEGIVRKYSLMTENGNNAIKSQSVWPTDRYFNVWVVKNINSASAGGGTILGYAQFPFTGPYSTDGVIIRSDMVGSIGTAANPQVGVPNLGRTLTHEAGHYLGLFHTFQDSCRGGDQVDDTPPVAAASYGACYPANINTCTNDNPDLPDQYENYMDYSSGSCQNIYTLGQKARMLAAIEKYRFVLVSNANLIATGTQTLTTPSCKPVAFFRSSAFRTCAGNSINYTDLSYNYTGGAATLSWSFPGGSPSTSTASAPVVSYAEPGSYDVTLIATTAKGSDTLYIKDYIKVVPKDAMVNNFLFEDFEYNNFAANKWETLTTTTTNWEVNNVASVSGGKNSMTVTNYAGQGGNVFSLISPTVSISASAPQLSFYYSFMQREKAVNNTMVPTNDALRVYTSTDCGATWVQRFAQSGSGLSTTSGYSKLPGISFHPVDASQWKGITVNLASIPAGQRSNVRIKFDFESDDGNNIFLDNINIGYGLGIKPVNMSEQLLGVYPNPTRQSVNISYFPAEATGAVSIMLNDITGKTVKAIYEGQSNGSMIELSNVSLDGITPGIYFVSVRQNGMNATQKLVITQ